MWRRVVCGVFFWFIGNWCWYQRRGGDGGGGGGMLLGNSEYGGSVTVFKGGHFIDKRVL